MRQTNISLNDTEHAKLKTKADELSKYEGEKISMAEVIRRAINAYIPDVPAEEQVQQEVEATDTVTYGDGNPTEPLGIDPEIDNHTTVVELPEDTKVERTTYPGWNLADPPPAKNPLKRFVNGIVQKVKDM